MVDGKTCCFIEEGGGGVLLAKSIYMREMGKIKVERFSAKNDSVVNFFKKKPERKCWVQLHVLFHYYEVCQVLHSKITLVASA